MPPSYPVGIVRQFIESLYSDSAALEYPVHGLRDVENLLRLSCRYEVKSIQHQCERYIESLFRWDMALDILVVADSLQLHDLRSKIVTFIIRCYDAVIQSDCYAKACELHPNLISEIQYAFATEIKSNLRKNIRIAVRVPYSYNSSILAKLNTPVVAESNSFVFYGYEWILSLEFAEGVLRLNLQPINMPTPLFISIQMAIMRSMTGRDIDSTGTLSLCGDVFINTCIGRVNMWIDSTLHYTAQLSMPWGKESPIWELDCFTINNEMILDIELIILYHYYDM